MKNINWVKLKGDTGQETTFGHVASKLMLEYFFNGCILCEAYYVGGGANTVRAGEGGQGN